MLRDLARRCVDSRWFQSGVLALIVFNAIILGADTIPAVRAAIGQALLAADRVIVYAFVGEIALRIYAYRWSYFKAGWNLFDFLIVFLSLFAASSGLSALRAFRVLRILRVITVIPRMRAVVSALLEAIPGIASAGVVIVLILYVFAVIAANLYGESHPGLFGDIFTAMYTLFQVMTLEGWPDIAESVRETHPRSWLFFVSFLLIGAFTLLNLFVAIVVRAVEEDAGPLFGGLVEEQRALREEIAALRREIAALARRER